jgi:hypothetical protein
MRLEYVVVSFVIALIVILLAVSLLTGVVPGVDFILGIFKKAV